VKEDLQEVIQDLEKVSQLKDLEPVLKPRVPTSIS